MADVQQCPNCGAPNDVGLALCSSCKLPLTAYSGQLSGEAYQGELASKTALVEGRPPIVAVVVALEVLFALLFPLHSVMTSFGTRTMTNAEGTNYLAAALGAVGPIVKAIFLVPAALAIIGVAIFTWLQNTKAWSAGVVVLAIIAACNFRPGVFPIATLLVTVVTAVIWFLPKTKAWFGLD